MRVRAGARRALVLALGLATARLDAVPALVERPDDQLLILELRLDREVLAEGLAVFHDGERLFVPLGELATALGLAIAVDVGAGTAEGFFLAENRRFSLDLERREVVVEGVRSALPAGVAELHAADVFVDAERFAAWFPVDLAPDLLRSRLLVRSREKLPIEERSERERRRRQLGERRRGSEPRWPALDDPYRLLDWPTLDQRLRLSIERGGGAGAPSTTRRLRTDLVAGGDLLFSSAELAVAAEAASGGRAGAPDLRLKLDRRDPEGGLLGALGATEIALGDLLTPPRALVSEEGFARGFEVSSFPLDRPEQLDRTTLSGDALPGWEVELYHNEELLDVRTVGAEARYEFTDVPLYLGLNLLRLVFYGPLGERREKVQRVLIGDDLIPAGARYYRFAAHQHERRFLGGSPGGFEIGSPPNAEGSSGEGAGGDWRLFAELEHGLRRGLSLTTAIQSLPLAAGEKDDGEKEGGERHSYATLGLRGTHRGGSRLGVYGLLDLAVDAGGGWAGRLAVEGDLPGARFRLERRQFERFVSEEARVDDPPRHATSLEIDARLPIARRPLRLVVSAARDEQRSGEISTTVSGRVAISLAGLALSHALRLRSLSGEEGELGGAVLVAGRRGRWRLRGSLGYTLRPRLALAGVDLGCDWRLSDDLTGRLELYRALAEDARDRVTASLQRRLHTLAVGIDLSVEEGGRLRAGLTLTTSLRRDPISQRPRWRSGSGATRGAVAARVFLDRDGDARFSAADEPLPGVALTTGGIRRADRTDEQGRVLLGELETARPIDVGLALRTLEDPAWLPRRAGVSLLPRPGRVASVDFPVVVTGEIDGTIRREVEGRRAAVAKVKVQLMDPAGTIVQEVTTAFDGFFLFAQVPPGRYRVRVEPRQLAASGHRTDAVEVTIGEEGTVMSGIDFLLTRGGLDLGAP